MLPRGITPSKAFMLFQRPFAKIVTPADLFNPALWLRPEDLPASGEISTWIDASGNGRNATQATSANRPVVLANALNGFRAASFDGVDDNLRTTNFVPITTGNYSYFLVYNHASTTTSRYLFLNGADIDGFGFRLLNGNQRVNQHAGISAMIDNNATPNVFEIVSLVRNSTPLATMEVNGSNQVITNNNVALNPPTFGFTLGSRQGDQFATANFCELLIYDKALNTTERASVTNYLKSKYNL